LKREFSVVSEAKRVISDQISAIRRQQKKRLKS